MKTRTVSANLGPTVSDAKEAMLAYQENRRAKKTKHSSDHWRPTWHLDRFKADDLDRTAHKFSYSMFVARELACLWNDPDFWQLIDAHPPVKPIAEFITENYFPLSEASLRACLRKLSWTRSPNLLADPGKSFFAMVKDKELRIEFFRLLFQEFEKFSAESNPERNSQVERFKNSGVDKIFIQYLWFPDFDLRELIRCASIAQDDLKVLQKAAANLEADIRSVLKGKNFFPDICRIRKKAKFQIKSLRNIDTLVELLKDNPELSYTAAALQLQQGLPKRKSKPMSGATGNRVGKGRRNLARTNLRKLAEKADLLVKFREKSPRNPERVLPWSKQKKSVI